jgi:hypothetical protein
MAAGKFPAQTQYSDIYLRCKGIQMKNSPLLKTALFNLVASFFLAAVSLFAVASAFAQSGPTGPTPPPYTPVITVTPAVAAVGVERQITVSGQWPSGCIPQGITPLREAASLTRALPIRLEIPLTLVACTAAITPYSYSTTFTPTTSGDYRLIVYGNDGLTSHEVLMTVRSTDPNRALYNLTGSWFDPATSGSGVVFIHGYSTTDTVFGAWFMYGQNGEARWYSIQEGRWRDATEWNGTLYETTAAPQSCENNLSVCPLPFRNLRRVGTARITMSGRFDVKLEALTTAGNPLFSSTLVKGL